MTVAELLEELQKEPDRTRNVWIQQSCVKDTQVLVVGEGTKEKQGDAYEIDLGKQCFHIWTTYYAHQCDLEVITRCIKYHTRRD